MVHSLWIGWATISTIAMKVLIVLIPLISELFKMQSIIGDSMPNPLCKHINIAFNDLQAVISSSLDAQAWDRFMYLSSVKYWRICCRLDILYDKVLDVPLHKHMLPHISICTRIQTCLQPCADIPYKVRRHMQALLYAYQSNCMQWSCLSLSRLEASLQTARSWSVTISFLFCNDLLFPGRLDCYAARCTVRNSPLELSGIRVHDSPS